MSQPAEPQDADAFTAEIDRFLAGDMPDSETLLREAWDSSHLGPEATPVLRRSLAAQARSDPSLRPVLRQLEGHGRTQLDLHVEGARESRHETSARILGQFLYRLSEAVKEVAKSVAGLGRLDGDLSVLAPAPGSVRVVFVEPEARHEPGSREDVWAGGIERLALTLELAQEGLDSLDASVQDLRVQARRALRLMAQTVQDGEWSLSGTLTARDGEQQAVHLGASAALRLIDATQRELSRTYTVSVEGVVDGWRWSSRTLRFLPTRGAAIEAFVPEAWTGFIAEHNARPGDRIEARLRVTEVPRERSTKVTYMLLSATDLPSLFDQDDAGRTES